MPIIFAQALMFVPGLLASSDNSVIKSIGVAFTDIFGLWYNILFAVLIIIFSYFYTAITIPTNKMADDLKRGGGFVPGIRPGKETADYLDTILSRITLPLRNTFYNKLALPPTVVMIVRILITFHLVSALWVLFRANSIGDALYIFSHIAYGWPHLFIDAQSMIHGSTGILIVIIVQVIQKKAPVRHRIKTYPVSVQWALCCIVIFAIILFGVEEGSQFIYFQF